MTGELKCEAIMLSDLVVKDQATGKLSLVNCFTMFNVANVPFTTPPFYITCFIANLRAVPERFSLTIRIEKSETGFVVANVAGQIGLKRDPVPVSDTFIIEVPFQMRPFALPEPGTYVVHVLADNETIGKRNFDVHVLTASAQAEEHA